MVDTRYYPKSIKACALRVTMLDDCDQAVDPLAVDQRATVKAFTEIKLSPDVQAAQSETLQNACDEVVIDDPGTAQRKGMNIDITLIGFVLPILALLIDADELLDAGVSVGGVLASTDRIATDSAAMIEFWSRNGTLGACVPGQTVSGQYTRWMNPKTSRWELNGDITYNRSGLTVALRGYATPNPNWVPGLPGTTFPSFDDSPAPGVGPWTGTPPASLPPGETADPWTLTHRTQIRAGGELAWIADVLPDLTSPTGYMPIAS